MPPHEPPHILNVLPHFHFGGGGFAIITQVHRSFAELGIGELREFKNDLSHAREALLGDKVINASPR